MLFPTISFAVFFAVVLPVSWLTIPNRTWWRLSMVAASWFFYGCAGWGFVPLLIGSTVFNHAIARMIDRRDGDRRKWLARAAVVVNLGALGYLKYIGFLSTSATSLLDHLGFGIHLAVPKVLLPAGISFFTFQALSYVIDINRRNLRPVSLLDFAVYLSFFPHLLSGPIVRASEFLPQIRRRLDARHIDASRGLWLITQGLFKKVVISSYLSAQAVDPLFGFPHQHGGVEALFGVYGYAIQIYTDFSGYTDIAIGLALLLGVQFPQNFDSPYKSRSLQEFWRRWHMTLSRWLRDYLYIPLGGNRKGHTRTYVNLMATMLLGGLWHGAAWTFVVWGAFHGVGLAIGRLRVAHQTRRMARRPQVATDPVVAVAPLIAAPAGVIPGAVVTALPSGDEIHATVASGVGGSSGAGSGGAGSSGGGSGGHGEPGPRPGTLISGLLRLRRICDAMEDQWQGRVHIPRPLRQAFAWFVTFNLVCLGWVFFRATSFGNATEVLSRLFSSGTTALNPIVVLVVVASMATQFIPTPWTARTIARFSHWSILGQALALGTVLIVIDVWGPAGVAPFIYFRF
jgi:alginate O-acetyltransferase complex protein AlgI